MSSSSDPGRGSKVESAAAPPIVGHFKEGRGYHVYRPQGSSDWVLSYTTDGRGYMSVPGGGVRSFCVKGSLSLLRPLTPVDYGVPSDSNSWEHMWAHFIPRAHWTQWLCWPEIAPGIMQIEIGGLPLENEVVRSFAEAMRHARTRICPNRAHFVLTALERLLIWCDLANPTSGHKQFDARVVAAVEHIYDRLHETTVGVAQVAREVGTSESRIAHLFREQMEVSLQRFIEIQRMERACELLSATARPVQSIAGDVGYDNPFYFSLRFKKHTGESPTEYRSHRTEIAQDGSVL